MTRNSDGIAQRKPNVEGGVASLSSARAAASSQSAAFLVELDLPSTSLPTATDGAATESLLAVRPQSERRCHNGFKPYRDIVTTQVYTVPSREGVPVRLSIPFHPSTGHQQFRRRARVVGVLSAQCAHPSRAAQQKIPINKSKRSAPGGHLGVRVVVASAPPMTPPVTQQLLVQDPSSRKGSSKARHGLASSSYPDRIKRVGGVRSQVDNDRCHNHPQALRYVQRSVSPRRDLTTFIPVCAMSRDTTKNWKPEVPRPPLKPRPLSAPARGRAIRRAVDTCCRHLPATSELSYGAAWFLRQWDGASRRQRELILKALADQLLVGDQRGEHDQQQQQQPRSSLHVEGIHRAEGTRELIFGQQAQNLETPDTSVEIYSHPACVLGASDSPSNMFDAISAKTFWRSRHCYREDQAGETAQPSGATGADDYSYAAKGTGFLELLGAHAGLLAARISSYLRTLHSCGHAIGICLRVTTLLAESTFETGQGGSKGSGSGSGNDSIAASLAQQLSTPGIIRVALETVSAKPASKLAAKPAARPAAAKPAANLVRRRTSARTSSSPPREDETNRAQALHLLLILVRAGGRQIKESLTCRSSIPGVDKSDDALDPIVVALRRSDCALGTRAAAGRLLVELGVGNPAGSGRVWSAVLCVLGLDECREVQILGCDVAHELLSTLSAGCGSSENGDDFPTSFMWSHEHRLQPDVLLVPSVLNLALSDCSSTREAGGKLATSLARVSGRCCCLLVAGLAGLLGTISGVKQRPPIAWRRHCPLRCEETPRSRYEDEVEVRWSELHQRNHRRVAELTGRGSNSYALSKRGIFCGVDFGNPGGSEGRQQGDIDNVLGFGSAGGRSNDSSQSEDNEAGNFFDGEPVRSAAESTDNDDHAIRAMATLRRICSEQKGAEVCLALFSTLAPLAVLELVVGPCLIEKVPSATGNIENTAADVAGESTFITQTRAASDGCASSATKDGIRTQDAVLSIETIACDQRHPARGIEDELIDANGGRSFPIQGSKRVGPRQAYFLAVAEALLAMYRCGGERFYPTKAADQTSSTTGNTHHDNGLPTPPPFPGDAGDFFASGSEGQRGATLSGEALKLKRLIDTALDGCRTLSSGLRNSDVAALARTFARGGDYHHADCCKEIAILRGNVLALTKRLGAARPPADDKCIILQ